MQRSLLPVRPSRPASARRAVGAFALSAGVLLLAGCDALGIESASVASARRDAEGKAIGAACRHAGRSIEACYGANRKAEKASVFAGWREMNDYMRENQIPETNEAAASAAAPAASGGRAALARAARPQAARAAAGHDDAG